MADDTNLRRPEDPTKINLSQRWEIDYWTAHFGVTEAELRAAVRAVGNSTEAVRRYLKK